MNYFKTSDGTPIYFRVTMFVEYFSPIHDEWKPSSYSRTYINEWREKLANGMIVPIDESELPFELK